MIKRCACGCGEKISDKDKYGRKHSYISGHNGRKYKDKTQHKREWNHRNKDSRYKLKLERGRRLKGKVINLMGGHCKDCGICYDTHNACIFQLHHKNPKKKEFVVNTRTLINYSWARILKEIKKCELLCANCHFVKENEEY